jgi:hypothetical protein
MARQLFFVALWMPKEMAIRDEKMTAGVASSPDDLFYSPSMRPQPTLSAPLVQGGI